MTISTTDFTAIRAFVAVGNALSFARAAEMLGLSTSALSQAVSGLEDRLGEPLLHRTTRSMSLTEAGETLLKRMSPLVKGMTDGLEEARVDGSEPRGTVRIHAYRTAARAFLAPVLHKFALDYPCVTIDLTLSDAKFDPVAAGYDAAIRLGEVLERDLVALRIGGSLRQRVVAAPSYIKRHGVPARPADLLNHHCIQWRWPGTSAVYDWEFIEGDRWFTVRTKGTIIVSERDFAAQLAIAGNGIAIVSEPLAQEHIASGALVSMLEPWCGEYPGFYLCYPQHRTVSRGLRALIDVLKATQITT